MLLSFTRCSTLIASYHLSNGDFPCDGSRNALFSLCFLHEYLIPQCGMFPLTTLMILVLEVSQHPTTSRPIRPWRVSKFGTKCPTWSTSTKPTTIKRDKRLIAAIICRKFFANFFLSRVSFFGFWFGTFFAMKKKSLQKMLRILRVENYHDKKMTYIATCVLMRMV